MIGLPNMSLTIELGKEMKVVAFSLASSLILFISFKSSLPILTVMIW